MNYGKSQASHESNKRNMNVFQSTENDLMRNGTRFKNLMCCYLESLQVAVFSDESLSESEDSSSKVGYMILLAREDKTL